MITTTVYTTRETMTTTTTTEGITAATIANAENAAAVVDLAATLATGVLEISEQAPTHELV